MPPPPPRGVVDDDDDDENGTDETISPARLEDGPRSAAWRGGDHGRVQHLLAA
jgi:hypothetical protein